MPGIRQTIILALSVAASGEGNLDFPMLFDGRLKELRYRFYPGPQLSLQLQPVKLRREVELPLVVYAKGGKQYIDGDNEDVTIYLDEELFANVDTLRIKYTNTDTVNAFDFTVDAVIWKGV